MDLGAALSESFATLFRVGVAALVWMAARHFATDYEPIAEGKPLSAYCRVAATCALLALIAWSSYGTHVEDADPLFGGGEEVQDFQPTRAERDQHGLVVFLTTFAIAAHGTWNGRNQWPRKRARSKREDAPEIHDR